MKKNEKTVRCPCCGGRVLDAAGNVDTEVKVVKLSDPLLEQELWQPDYYIKCWKCKAKLAIRKTTE